MFLCHMGLLVSIKYMPKTSEYSGEDRLSASPAEHFYIKRVKLFIHAPALFIENTFLVIPVFVPTQYLELESLSVSLNSSQFSEGR